MEPREFYVQMETKMAYTHIVEATSEEEARRMVDPESDIGMFDDVPIAIDYFSPVITEVTEG